MPDRQFKEASAEALPSPLDPNVASPEAEDAEDMPPLLRRASTSLATTLSRRRRRKTTEEALTDSLTPSIPSYGLRHRRSEPDTPSALEKRSSRLTRRTKSSGSILDGRRSSNYVDSNSDESEDDESDTTAADDDDGSVSGEESYRKAAIDALPEEEREEYHHSGRGWYKKRSKSNIRVNKPKARDITDNVFRLPDGTYRYDRTKNVHQSQLEKFSGEEFHHCGNGWYKTGPSDYRTSVHIPKADDVSFDDWHDVTPTTYTGEETRLFQPVQWVPYGYGDGDNDHWIPKGRSDYAGTIEAPHIKWVKLQGDDFARAVVRGEKSHEGTSSTFNRSYVDTHPNEEFHHVGNERYRSGLRPDSKSKAHAKSVSPDNQSLYTKEYVAAHPHYEFHHRGQGRYRLGSREMGKPIATGRPAASAVVDVEDSEDGENEEDEDEEGPEQNEDEGEVDEGGGSEEEDAMVQETETLVDSTYVDAHPLETFHHRGQGRWARGLPPFGSSRKMAIRGPGAADRSTQDGSSSSRRSISQSVPTGPPPPPRSALFIRAEGPEKWPELNWFYRGGGKWSQLTKEEWDVRSRGASKLAGKITSTVKGRKGKHSTSTMNGASAQLSREAAAATAEPTDDDEGDGVVGNAREVFGSFSSVEQGNLRGRGRPKRNLPPKQSTALSTLTFKAQLSSARAKQPMLTEEEDRLTEADLPDLYLNEYSPSIDTELDEAERLYRHRFRPLDVDSIISALEKHDAATRTTGSLKLLAENAQLAMQTMQDEFLELERLTAPHAKIPRRPALGGRKPLDQMLYEDRKEADLYDYTFDPRKIGHQDPDAQRIVRDDQGRQLRKNRRTDLNGSIPGWNLDGEGDLAPKRASRQPQRFHGNAAAAQPRKKAPATQSFGGAETPGGSMTPDRTATPVQSLSQGSAIFVPPVAGRWAGHVPKRIRELRGESVGSTRSGDGGPEAKIRKGRPPGSKNLHARKDKGVKKGPRKPKSRSEMDIDGEFDGASHAEDNMDGPDGQWETEMDFEAGYDNRRDS